MNFSDFFGNADALVVSTAKLLDEATAGYKAGNMTQAEYQDLCATISNDFTKEQALVTDMVRKQALVEALEGLISIVQAIV